MIYETQGLFCESCRHLSRHRVGSPKRARARRPAAVDPAPVESTPGAAASTNPAPVEAVPTDTASIAPAPTEPAAVVVPPSAAPERAPPATAPPSAAVGGFAPTTAAIWGGLGGAAAGALLGIGTLALVSSLVPNAGELSSAAWACTVFMGAGAGAGLARAAAGDPEHALSAGVATTLGSAAGGVIGYFGGAAVGDQLAASAGASDLGSLLTFSLTSIAVGTSTGTLIGAGATPFVHGLVVDE